MSAIRQGVAAAYDGQKLPYAEIVFDKISEAEIGAFMQFKMMETMFLGRLLHVNTFDQPNVELYKTETKRILHG
jgi:glucose-6-phosphate isomerase